MEIKVVQDAKSIEADILVVNKFEDENTSNELANKYAVEQDNFKGKFGETYLLPTYGKEIYRKVLVLGLGKKSEFNPDKMREAIAKAVKKAMQMEAKKVAFSLDGIEFDYSEQFAMGAFIADYAFDKYKSEKKDNKVQEVYVQANADIVKKAEKIASAMAFARNLANEPAQFATPTELANIACDFGLDTVVYNREECEGMRDYFDWFLISIAKYQKKVERGDIHLSGFEMQLQMSPEYNPAFLPIKEWEEQFFLKPYFEDGEPVLLFKAPLEERLKVIIVEGKHEI